MFDKCVMHRMLAAVVQQDLTPLAVSVTTCHHRRLSSTCSRIQSMLFSTLSSCSVPVPSSQKLGLTSLDPVQRMYVHYE